MRASGLIFEKPGVLIEGTFVILHWHSFDECESFACRDSS